MVYLLPRHAYRMLAFLLLYARLKKQFLLVDTSQFPKSKSSHSATLPNDVDPFFTNIVDVYDADTNTWSVTHMKEKRAYTASVIFKNKLYVAGGSRGLYDELQDPYNIRPFEELEYSNSVEVYD